VAQLSIAFHSPGAAHPDWLPLFLLGSVLSSGRSSRLYRNLVMTGLASSAGAGLALTRDPYLFRLSATARRETEPPALEAAALAELAKVAEEGVSDAELAKVRRQLRAGHVFSTEGVTNQARYLGQYEMAQGWRAFETYLDDLARVTTEDLARVARTYLVERNRTVGWFIPSDG
jgi:zinc protease